MTEVNEATLRQKGATLCDFTRQKCDFTRQNAALHEKKMQLYTTWM